MNSARGGDGTDCRDAETWQFVGVNAGETVFVSGATGKETVVSGIEQAVVAFIGLFDGTNVGKMVVRLA